MSFEGASTRAVSVREIENVRMTVLDGVVDGTLVIDVASAELDDYFEVVNDSSSAIELSITRSGHVDDRTRLESRAPYRYLPPPL